MDKKLCPFLKSTEHYGPADDGTKFSSEKFKECIGNECMAWADKPRHLLDATDDGSVVSDSHCLLMRKI